MSAVLITVACLVFAIIFGIILRVFQKSTNAKCDVTKDLRDRTVIVTGGTAGMGLEVALNLANRGAKVIIACPFEEEGNTAKRIIIDETRNVRVLFKRLDLSSLASVRQFADDVLKTESRLDILVNNAGVLIPDEYTTADNMNFAMQVNYFGHFLLTLLLLPLMKKTGTESEASRIINMTSVLHRFGNANIKKVNRVGYWYKWQTYCNSKLCMAMFTTELSKKLRGSNVVVNSVDPGAVGTRIFDSCGLIVGSIITFLFSSFFKTPLEGAQTALYVALDDEAGKVSGEFFKNCKLSRGIKAVYNEALCKKLWDGTVSLVCLEHERCVWEPFIINELKEFSRCPIPVKMAGIQKKWIT